MKMENTQNIKIDRLELRLAEGMCTHEPQPRHTLPSTVADMLHNIASMQATESATRSWR